MAAFSPAAARPQGPVVVIPITGTIDEGMAHLVDPRGRRGAGRARARHRAGGEHLRRLRIAPATEIRDALLGSTVPVDAYVTRAWSAGALVTLSAAHIVMAPGASIGAAQPIPKTVKTVSALRSEFEATAGRYHRNDALAGADGRRRCRR